ncbi:MAG: ribonuclease [Leadbetterella sp.]|nr:ribonuclease [Leadbetterella sp.]
MNKLLIYILLFLGGLGLGYFWGQNSHNETFDKNETQNTIVKNTSQDNLQKLHEEKAEEITASENDYSNDNTVVPNKVWKVLSQIEETGEAPDGYVGGRKFKNLEGLLTKADKNNKKINYKEWDVNPKIEGKNRGKERLVTGDDKSAYFTNDHYESFKKIK